MKYDESILFFFTKSEAQSKVGKAVRAKVDTSTTTALSYPIPKGTPGTVTDASKFEHRRWVVVVKWNIELTPTYPGQELNDDDRYMYCPRRKYEAEIIEVNDEEKAA